MATRRTFLQGLLSSGMAASFPLAAIERARAITPEPGTTFLDAEHIVILMQENRSFDHMFGTLQGVRGFNDPRALRQADGAPVFVQRDAEGRGYLPWRLDINDSRVTWMGDLPHGWTDQIDAWNGGAHNFWVQAKQSRRAEYAHIPMTMGYYTRADLPFYYALADAFTICDQHYCGIMSATTPNRLTLWAGTVREQHEAGDLLYLSNEQTHFGGLRMPSFPERLEQAGVNWKCYQNQIWCEDGVPAKEADWLSNFGDNPLERFENYPVHFDAEYREYTSEVIDRLESRIEVREVQLRQALKQSLPRSTEAQELETTLRAYEIQKQRLDYKRGCGNVDLSDLTEMERTLRSRGLAINSEDPDFMEFETLDMMIDGTPEHMQVPKGDLFHQFRKDVQSDNLPTVSWLVAPGKFSDHPSRPWYGAWYVSEAMNILTENPDVWKKTIFILTYDENDGYFDHAVSFVAADPKRSETGGASPGIDCGQEYAREEDLLIQGYPAENARSGPTGLGYRVPLIVASPWSRGGWVNSQVCDHTSIIQFVERFIEGKNGKQVREENISDWRRTVSGDLTSIFRRFDGEGQDLPFLKRNAWLEEIARARQKPLPTGYEALDQAEIAALKTRKGKKRVPQQETGTRPACTLPYELHADGAVDPARGQFRLNLRAARDRFGRQAAGSPFNVYLYGAKSGSHVHAVKGMVNDMAAATYAVRAGDELTADVNLARFLTKKYDIAVHGPNGFYREFRGTDRDPKIKVKSHYRSTENGDVRLDVEIANQSSRAKTVRVTHEVYQQERTVITLEASSSVTVPIDFEDSFHWYDFVITVEGMPAFHQRYAGHVETGYPSSTDPVMGRG